MQYFVRAWETHKDSKQVFGPELLCPELTRAKAEAKQLVLTADPALRLQADACCRNRGIVITKYRCWINEKGDFQERALV